MNTVEKTTTGVTPAELILNNSIRLSSRILAAPIARNSSARLALSDTMDTWIQKQHTLIKAAQANQRSSDFHLLVEYDPRITEYPVHSYVLFTPPVGRRNKLLPRHRGPFQVMDKTDSIYTIEDLVNGKRITTHIHNLRPFVYDPDQTSPLTVALHNEQEFVIESVLAHRGNRHRRSTLEFHIRWAGFGETHYSWEPFTCERLFRGNTNSGFISPSIFPWGTSKNGGSFQDFFRGFFPNAVLVFPRLF